MKDTNALRSLEDYPSRVSAEIRYSDLDRQGHVNNAVFATFSEIGRVAFLYDAARPLTSAGASFVVVRLLINFHAELFWPGTVEIGTGVSKIGRSSISLLQGMFNNGRLVASTEATIVLMDGQTRRSAPLPSKTLDILQGLLLAGAPLE